MFCVFFFNDTATTEIYTLSLHDALPICQLAIVGKFLKWISGETSPTTYVAFGKKKRQNSALSFRAKRSREIPRCNHSVISRSEEHTSELQSPCNLVCRLLLEKKTAHMSC